MFVKLDRPPQAGPSLANSQHTLAMPSLETQLLKHKQLVMPLSSDYLFLILDCLRFFVVGLIAVILIVIVVVLL